MVVNHSPSRLPECINVYHTVSPRRHSSSATFFTQHPLYTSAATSIQHNNHSVPVWSLQQHLMQTTHHHGAGGVPRPDTSHHSDFAHRSAHSSCSRAMCPCSIQLLASSNLDSPSHRYMINLDRHHMRDSRSILGAVMRWLWLDT
jgi:hypothetical protein